MAAKEEDNYSSDNYSDDDNGESTTNSPTQQQQHQKGGNNVNTNAPTASNNNGNKQKSGNTVGTKAVTFTTKGAPVKNARGTRFPTNIQVVARIRPFHDAELKAAAAAAAEGLTASGTPAIPFRARRAATNDSTSADGTSNPQSIIRLGLPDQGVFQNYPVDAVAWGVADTHREVYLQQLEVKEEEEEGEEEAVNSNAAAEGAHQNGEEGAATPVVPKKKKKAAATKKPKGKVDQIATWEAVGQKLVDSVVYPMGGRDLAKASSSSSSTTPAAIYGNACLVSYGASNSGKSFSLFGSINPAAPPPAPIKDTDNSAAITLANEKVDAKTKSDAFYYAGKNKAKRDRMLGNNAPPTSYAEGSASAIAAAAAAGRKNGGTTTPSSNPLKIRENLIKTAKQVLPASTLNTVATDDGLIVRTADALLSSVVAAGSAALHMACLRLHNERLTDLCDLDDPHETKTITAQLYYPDSGIAGAITTEASLHYYGLRGVKPTKVESVGDVKELILRARQQVQRAPAGYLAKAEDVVPSTKGKIDEKDIAVKARLNKEKKAGELNPSSAAGAEGAIDAPPTSASVVHGSTVIIILYLVPTPPNKKDAAAASSSSSSSALASLPPRTALQKIMFVDLPDSNAISKGVSTTSINIGKEIIFSNVSAETPLQIANDKAINSMLLALGSSLADSAKYGRGRFQQHGYMFGGQNLATGVVNKTLGVTSAAMDNNNNSNNNSSISDAILEKLLGNTRSGTVMNQSSTMMNADGTLAITANSQKTLLNGTMGNGATPLLHYRNSLLTKVLKEATYGPNTYTVVLGCLSPSVNDLTHSTNTLRFLQGVKSQPVTIVGYEEMELLRANATNPEAPTLGFTKSVVLGSLKDEGGACEAFDLSVERKAAEKAKVNPYTMLKLGATISSGAAASLAPTNVKKEENQFFKTETTARNDLYQLFVQELTNMSKDSLQERLVISKRANQSKKLTEAIANGNAAIGTNAAARSRRKSQTNNQQDEDGSRSPLVDDFEAQFRAPHKITTSPQSQRRGTINNDTSAFIKEHHQKYRFRDEPKGKAHVGVYTIEMSNRAFKDKQREEEQAKLRAEGKLPPKTHPTVNGDTSTFMKEHNQKYRFKDELKGTAHVGVYTIEMSNRAFAEKQRAEAEAKSGGASKPHKEGPPRFPHKKASPTTPREDSTSSSNAAAAAGSPKQPHKPAAGNKGSPRGGVAAAAAPKKTSPVGPHPPAGKDSGSPRGKQIATASPVKKPTPPPAGAAGKKAVGGKAAVAAAGGAKPAVSSQKKQTAEEKTGYSDDEVEGDEYEDDYEKMSVPTSPQKAPLRKPSRSPSVAESYTSEPTPKKGAALRKPNNTNNNDDDDMEDEVADEEEHYNSVERTRGSNNNTNGGPQQSAADDDDIPEEEI